jgi:hypothetical protein
LLHAPEDPDDLVDRPGLNDLLEVAELSGTDAVGIVLVEAAADRR